MRRPKGDKALTGAERQAAYRQRERHKRSQAGADYSQHIYDLEGRLQEARAAADKLDKENAVLRKENTALCAQVAVSEQRAKNMEQRAKSMAQGKPQITIPPKIIGALGMLGSEHAGERDNAARVVERWRRTTGKSWDDLVQ
jgi:chromosome segregation ATPase